VQEADGKGSQILTSVYNLLTIIALVRMISGYRKSARGNALPKAYESLPQDVLEADSLLHR